MKVCTKGITFTIVGLISTWGLSGCSKSESAKAAKTDALSREAKRSDGLAEHAEGQTGHSRREHGDHHDHGNHNHGDHKHGDHHGKVTPSPGAVQVGNKVPDFSVQTLDGKSLKLSELQKDQMQTKKGVVVLSFWCSTCHSCRDVEHLLAKLRNEYEGEAAVLALDANANETGDRVAAFLKKRGLALPVILDPNGRTADLFGVQRTTTTVVIDEDGVLRYCGQFRQKGGGSAEEALKAVLAGNEVAIKTTPHNG